jgi:hypothetical protein
MSAWTQVCGVIRVDAHAVDFDEKISCLALLYRLIGPIYQYDNNHEEECTLPTGSEGSMEYHIDVTRLHDSSVHLFDVTFSGSLRDFTNEKQEVEQWFSDLIRAIDASSAMAVRDSALTVTH